MVVEEIVDNLKIIGNELLTKTNKIDCYLFGSFLTNPILANDIDILIIYDNENQMGTIKQAFGSFATFFPLHLNYFTFIEEQELNFIKQQNAKKIFSL